MTVRGKRILLSIPQQKEIGIELSEKDKELIMKEEIKKWSSLEVFAIGDSVDGEKMTVGDKVYVPTNSLQYAEKVMINDHVKFLVSENDIAIVW